MCLFVYCQHIVIAFSYGHLQNLPATGSFFRVHDIRIKITNRFLDFYGTEYVVLKQYFLKKAVVEYILDENKIAEEVSDYENKF